METLTLNLPISIRFKFSLSLKILWLLVLISIISLLVLYVFQVNSLTSENYLLKNQERKLTEMKKESETLKIDFAKANSLTNLESYFQNRDFEKANQVKYIQILETSIAKLPRNEVREEAKSSSNASK